MTDLSAKILAEIEQEHIKPIPRWHFLLKNYVFWGLCGASVLLGSLAFSVVVEMAKNSDWDLFGEVHDNIFSSTVMALPYFWAIFLFMFALIAYYNWKHTSHWYRFKRRWIFATSVGASILLGSIFYALGWGREVDRLMTHSLHVYDASKWKARVEIWQHPENGLLIGKITDINSGESTFVVEDSVGNSWLVAEKEVSAVSDKPAKKGRTVKILGKKAGEREFEAKEIRRCGDCDDDDSDEEEDDEDRD